MSTTEDRKHSEVRKRTRMVAVRLLPEEFDALKRLAESRRVSRGEVLRAGVFESGPELIPIWQDTFTARWLVSTASDADPSGEDYWSGWTDVDADALRGVVELNGVEYTPAEARNMAEAFRQAADHAERFGTRAAWVIDSLRDGGAMPEIDHLPVEVQRIFRDALRSVADRYRKQQAEVPR